MPDPGLALLGTGAAAYAWGLRRLWAAAGSGRVVHRHQAWSFAAGVAVVGLALAPPLHHRAEVALSAHMAQHVLLMAVAAPLLANGSAVTALSWAFPPRWRRPLQAGWRSILGVRRSTRGVWLAGSVVVVTLATWVWHLPVLYQAALNQPALHAVEHACFLGSAMAFWEVVAGAGRRSRAGAGVIGVFVVVLGANALGAGMTLATHPWYPAYVRGSVAAAVEDQQLAGVLMWGVGGLISVVAAAVLFASWVGAAERKAPSAVAAPGPHPTPGPRTAAAPAIPFCPAAAAPAIPFWPADRCENHGVLQAKSPVADPEGGCP
ncbi:MAG: cytochrome c oxidase assembly protein [Acidimicrobiales bacterium]